MLTRTPDSRRRSSAKAEETSYMASATDLMTGLLFVFIILVAFLALQKKMEQDRSGKNKDPRGEVTRLIGRELAKSIPNIVVDTQSGVITLPESSFFASGSDKLTAKGAQSLSLASKRLENALSCYVASEWHSLQCAGVSRRNEIDTIFIEGHTDSRPMPRLGGNLKLSLDRAVSVGEALNRNTRLDKFRNMQKQPIFSYSAYADKRPLDPRYPAAAINRRVEFRIVLAYKPENDAASKQSRR